MSERKMKGREFQDQRFKNADDRLESLVKKYIAAGMPEKQARDKAYREMRDNPHASWLDG